jgi:tetratricopeptide (TPR) repeat protein
MALKGAEAVERFQREVRAVAKLKHPNIIQVYEVGIQDKYHYFTMEYVEGTSLENLIASRKLSARRAAELVRDIASALDYAHQQKIIHRDIKPANILIAREPSQNVTPAKAGVQIPASAGMTKGEETYSGRVYLTDFGLAKEATGLERSLTLSGTVVGTPDYMSPEQARGEKQLDRRADIFSLGATLYHALTGSVPFRGKELYQVLESVVHKEPLAPSRITKNLPSDLETICLKCLEKEPGRRYQNGRELAEDIARYLNGESIQARPVSTTEKIWREAKKNKFAAIATASALVILITGIVWLATSAAAKSTKIDLARNDARAAFADKNYDKAKDACNRILALSPQDKEAQGILAECAQSLKARGEEIDRTMSAAEAEAKRIKEAQEKRASARAVLDRIKLITTPTPDDKIKIAQNALKIDPDSGDAWQEIGYACNEKGEIDKAFEAFSKAVELTPTLAYSYYERGRILMRKGKTEETRADFENVIKYDPNSHIGWFAKGTLEKDPDKRLACYDKALELNPDFADAYLLRGIESMARTGLGGIEKSMKDMEKAIELLEPKKSMCKQVYFFCIIRSLFASVKREFDTTIKYASKAIKLIPDFSSPYCLRGSAYLETGLPDKAIADCTRAIELKDTNQISSNPDNLKTAEFSLALEMSPTERMMTDEELAKSMQKLFQLDEAYRVRGMAYKLKGDKLKALTDFESFLKLVSPKHPYAIQIQSEIDLIKKELKNIR